MHLASPWLGVVVAVSFIVVETGVVILLKQLAPMSAFGIVDRLVGRKSPELKALGEKLKLGFSGNVTVEMGAALFRLAKVLDRSGVDDLQALTARIERREMPETQVRPEFSDTARHEIGVFIQFYCGGKRARNVASAKPIQVERLSPIDPSKNLPHFTPIIIAQQFQPFQDSREHFN